MAIIKHDLPFSFVKYDGGKDVFNYVNPNIKLISKNTITFDVWKIYLNEKEYVKDELVRILGRVCLTFDL